MNDAVKQIDANTQAQIDRLVAGELPDGERNTLLAWLDEDARRWRVCALAFLEAQLWEEAASPERCRERPPWRSGTRESRPVPNKAFPMVTIAASLLLAFCAGAGIARIWSAGIAPSQPQYVETPRPPASDEATARDSDQPLLATVQVRTNLAPQVPMRLQLPVTTTADAAPRAPAMSDYERMQWERRGFEVKEVVRYLPARLPDGREVVVPVNTMRVEFKGTPVL